MKRRLLQLIYWCNTLCFAALFVSFTGCKISHPVSAINKSYVQYQGRVEINKDDIVRLYWPGTSVKTKFKGTGLKATLQDERGRNRYMVIIDEDSLYTLRPDSSKKTYTLASGLPGGHHTIELYRLTDWFEGATTFFGFEYNPGEQPISLPAKKRSIEFYGNSISVGAGMLERDTLIRRGNATNNYLSYGAIVARHYNAAYTCIASSGIGLMVSWGSLVMPDIYNRLNPADSNSHWNFSQYKPDIVVVNLLQNDYALSNMPEHEQFKKKFGVTAPGEAGIVAAYRHFLARLRKHYPYAHIICTLGSMDAVKNGSPWPGYITQSVALMADKKIYTCFFKYINGPGHPNAGEHREMAEALISFIDKNINW